MEEEQIGRRIVVAEDEIGIRSILVDALESVGHETIGVSNGNEALKTICSLFNMNRHVDLLVTDIKMPEMNGLELIENLEKQGIFVPVLVLTGYGDKELLVELIRRGCRDYLDKPFKLSELIDRVGRVVAKEDEARVKVADYILRVEKSKRSSVSPNDTRIGAINKGVAVRKIGSEWIMLDIMGELTEDTATMLRAIAEDHIEKGARKLNINLTSSGYFSSYGMGVVVYLWKRIAEVKGQLTLISGEVKIRQKIEELNLSRVMRIFDTEDDFTNALAEGWLAL